MTKEQREANKRLYDLFGEDRVKTMWEDFLEINRILTEMGVWTNLYKPDERLVN